MDWLLGFGEGLLFKDEFMCLRVSFMTEWKMGQEIDRWSISSCVATILICFGEERSEPEAEALNLPTSPWSKLTYGRELWIVTERMRLRIHVKIMSFLCRLAELRPRKWGMSVNKLLSHMEWSRCCGACPFRKRNQGRPRTQWSDYISWLAWEDLSIDYKQLVEVVWASLLNLFPPWPGPR